MVQSGLPLEHLTVASKVMILGTFLLCVFTVNGLIGLLASRKSQKSEQDYYLAQEGISPYMLALSASASKYSGFMFAGFMGLAYSSGTAALWLGFGLLSAHFLSYALVVTRIQKMNKKVKSLSVGELISSWNGEKHLYLRRLIGLISLFFLCIYAAAQLKAAGKALEVALETPAYVGILLSSALIIFYCWSGGIRASIWTDSAQIVIMVSSIFLILLVSMINEGGVGAFFESFMASAPPGSDETKIFPQNLSVGGVPGLALYILGAISYGMGSLGQPHILIRPMALKNPKDTKKFLITSYATETVIIVLFSLAGLATRIILADTAEFDPELSLFLSSLKVLPPIAVGFVLAGAFSSTMSTADSQVLSCSSTLLRDFSDPPMDSLPLAKLATIAITITATLIALFARGSIFSLVVFAFSGMGASIGSILILKVLKANISERESILITLTGVTTVIVWKSMDLSTYINESAPGFIAAFSLYFLLRFIKKF